MTALVNRHRRSLAAICVALSVWLQQTGAVGQTAPEHCDTLAKASLPDWFRMWFDYQGGPRAQYETACYLNPFYQRGNFDGRGPLDLAVLVVQRSTGKRGVLVVHRPGLAHFIVGAGTEIGNGGDDFEWMDVWSVAAAPRAESGRPEAGIIAEVLDLVKSESASGWVGFNGRKYVWVQGDD